MTRINVSNDYLPGVTSETTLALGSEIHRCDIFKTDAYVGQVGAVVDKRLIGVDDEVGTKTRSILHQELIRAGVRESSVAAYGDVQHAVNVDANLEAGAAGDRESPRDAVPLVGSQNLRAVDERGSHALST